MVKKKTVKKEKKVEKKVKKIEKVEDEDEGLSLDDAFGDDEDVEYAESKPKKKKGMSEDEIEEELDEVEEKSGNADVPTGDYIVEAKKPISSLKKGDKIRVDGKEFTVDAHYLLINHGTTKEMAIEVFDASTDKDYQIRYFDDQIETTIEFYELQEIMYIKKPFSKISW